MADDDDDLKGFLDEKDDEEVKDAGLDDDEGGNEAQTGQESEDVTAQEGQVDEERQPSRATRRVQESTRLAREAQERAQALEREVQQLRAERAQREAAAARPQEESPEQEAQRLALMTVDERVEYRLQKAERKHQFERNVDAFRTADLLDKTRFDAKIDKEPRYKKYAVDVERLLAEERRNGRDFPRETILTFVIGQRVMNGGADREKAAKAGAARIQSQQARADSGRSDRAAPRRGESTGNSIRDLEKRLEGVYI